MTHAATARQIRNTNLNMHLAAACRDPRHHRALVLAANAGLVACNAAEPFAAALAMHLVLLPFNDWRLLQALRMAPTSRPAAAVRADVLATKKKALSMRRPTFDLTNTRQTIRLDPRAAR
jgi:hypothetical protein